MSRSAWKDMVRKYRIEDARIDPVVAMVPNDQWMEFSVRYVVDYKTRRSIKDRIYTRLVEEIERSEGRVSISPTSTEVHLVGTAPSRLVPPAKPNPA